MSSANALTVAYRSSGSFLSALSTMVSMSPRKCWRQDAWSAATLGRTGSVLAMACSSAARVPRARRYGLTRLVNSYSSTPSE
jgi:hypothetical protein